MNIRRLFVEKKPEFAIEADALKRDLQENLMLVSLKSVRIIHRYDMQGISDDVFVQAKNTIFSEPQVDFCYENSISFEKDERVFAVEYLPGQFDQRSDSAAQCIQILTQGVRPKIVSARLIVLKGEVNDSDFVAVKAYCINAVDSREASMEMPKSLDVTAAEPADVVVLSGFVKKSEEELLALLKELGLAMSISDLAFCQKYFRDEEQRDPTITEIRMLDTYWSDHCRHTTFLSKITDIEFAEGEFTEPIKAAYESYLASRDFVYGKNSDRDISLMDIALIGAKELRKKGKLDDLEVSEEINAASIVVPVDVNGKTEDWLVMFKNETHNHPTEIEPFGGAATCIGGAIRDPLSGRSYVYQAMRVTGSADPRIPFKDTIPGKLPQRKITRGAAHGYSSYGNQIGLATGQVCELYHPNYVAKRMEIGAVVAAAPKANVFRGVPSKGDKIILLGGRTGRDGIGGATGSSKEHNEGALQNSAEVQKGDAPMERKLQRLFRNATVSKMIKRCNDFGAGGVSVAIGELSDSLDIDLDCVPKKYDGLDGTEIAISESQERMAVVLDPKDMDDFIAHAAEENLEASIVAEITDTGRLRMKWRGKTIVDITRVFINTNGVKQNTKIRVEPPREIFASPASGRIGLKKLADVWKATLSSLNVCSQKGLVEYFDSTIGAGTVLHPFGGKEKATSPQAMAALIPVLNGKTNTGTLMSHSCDPYLFSWSPFHGGIYAVLESVGRIVATGGDMKRIRLTFQEYFERLGQNPSRWGKPFAALLGALEAQKQLGIPAIGGKDSMSGTFKDLDVPPTLVSFAIAPVDVRYVISPEFKKIGQRVYLFDLPKSDKLMPDFSAFIKMCEKITSWIAEGKVVSAFNIGKGGLVEAISKMCFGNKIGFNFTNRHSLESLIFPEFGDFVIEVSGDIEDKDLMLLGTTIPAPVIEINGEILQLGDLKETWDAQLESVFPTHARIHATAPAENVNYEKRNTKRPSVKIAKPRVFIPVFPGTNCEYDSARAFELAGAVADIFVLKNRSERDVEETIAAMAERVNNAQILMLPGGFSAGDEPEGSGKFIATVFRNARIKDATMHLLKERDGLALGVCNGFQALIKLGLVPFGEIRDMDASCPTLTFNDIGRHVSCYVDTRVASVLSPWFANSKVGDIHTVPVSHGEGKFVCSEELYAALVKNGQIATQYVDASGKAGYDIGTNPNGSYHAVEGITSPDGRVLGKMAHSERYGDFVGKNISGNKQEPIFRSGVEYFL